MCGGGDPFVYRRDRRTLILRLAFWRVRDPSIILYFCSISVKAPIVTCGREQGSGAAKQRAKQRGRGS